MQAFLYGVFLQWKLDLRRRDILIVYYLLPLVFFLFMGSVFSSINPEMRQDLIPAMNIFAISIGGFIGSPDPLNAFYHSDMKKAYQVAHIPLWTPFVNNFISAFVHLFITNILIIIIAPSLYGSLLPESIGFYLLGLILYLLGVIGIGSIIGIFIKSNSKITMISQLFFLPSIMLSGIMFPATMLPEVMQIASKILPATWAREALHATSFSLAHVILLVILIVSVLVSIIKIRKIYTQ